jgi:uncharacterized membrane protein
MLRINKPYDPRELRAKLALRRSRHNLALWTAFFLGLAALASYVLLVLPVVKP